MHYIKLNFELNIIFYNHEKATSFKFLFVPVSVYTLLLTSCQAPKPDLAQIKTEIQALENGYADGLNSKDPDGNVVKTSKYMAIFEKRN